MLIFKLLKPTLKLYEERICHYQEKNSNFGMMHGNYLVKVGSHLLLSYLVGGFYGRNGVKWNTMNRTKWYDTIALMEFVMGMVFINNRHCCDPDLFI